MTNHAKALCGWFAYPPAGNAKLRIVSNAIRISFIHFQVVCCASLHRNVADSLLYY